MLIATVFGPLSLAQKEIFSATNIDCIELRLDSFSPILSIEEIAQLMTVSLPFMFTCRKKEQGGCVYIEEQKRLEYVKNLCVLRPQYLDLEYDVSRAFVHKIKKNFPHIQIICSYHNFSYEKKSLDALFKNMKNPYFDGYKIAIYGQSAADLVQMALFMQKMRKKKIFFCGILLGIFSVPMRILGKIWGSSCTYCYIQRKKVLGQLSAERLRHFYRYPHLNAKTKVFALLGNNLEGSPSDIVNNALYYYFDIDAVHVKIPIDKNSVQDFFPLAQRLFAGFSVTSPLKKVIIPYMNALEGEATTTQAVNTVQIHKGKAVGYNTDGKGAIAALKQELSLSGKKVVLIGAGGAASAIAHALKQENVECVICNRTEKKAQKIAQETQMVCAPLKALSQELKKAQVVINTAIAKEPFYLDYISPNTVVMDIVHNNRHEVHKKAHKRKYRVIDSYKMWEYLTLEQMKIWHS